MRQWQCECGSIKAFGTDSPRDCQVCKKCGTTMLRTVDGRVPPTEHSWINQYDRNTGKITHRLCTKCYEHDKNVPADTSRRFDKAEIRQVLADELHKNLFLTFQESERASDIIAGHLFP